MKREDPVVKSDHRKEDTVLLGDETVEIATHESAQLGEVIGIKKFRCSVCNSREDISPPGLFHRQDCFTARIVSPPGYFVYQESLLRVYAVR